MTANMAENGIGRQGSRWLRHFAMLFLGLMLAACNTMVPRTTAPPPETTTTPEVATGLPTDTERHRVALLVPQTGPDAAVGESIANATTMAILDSRSDRVRITIYDTGAGAAAAAQQAIAEGNKLILGPLLADDVRAVAPIASAANVPLISFSNDSSVAGNGTYLLGFEPGQSVNRVVAYARAHGVNNFGALVPRSVYGDRALAAMRARIVTPEQAPQLHALVDRLCAMADMPKPRVAIAEGAHFRGAIDMQRTAQTQAKPAAAAAPAPAPAKAGA